MKEYKYIQLCFLLITSFLFLGSCDDDDEYNDPIQIETRNLKNVSYDSAECGGEVITGKAKERGICWNTMPMPTVDQSKTQEGSGSGSYKSILTGLSEGTIYYVRAWAKNGNGEVVYGEEKKCVTMAHGRPVVNISSIEHIKEASSVVTSQMLVDGGVNVSDYGIIYSETDDLDINKGTVIKLAVSKNPIETILNNLTDNTLYYVMAYATYKSGTVYSDIASFTTMKYADPQSSLIVNEITGDGFEVEVTVVSGTPLPILEYGLVYGKATKPTIEKGVVKKMGEGDGKTRSEVDGLEGDTQYYVRPYTKNKNGVSYGEETTVLTLSNKALVSTIATTHITAHRAYIGGEVLSLGLKGVPIKEVGICWNTKANPGIENSHVKSNASGVGEFNPVLLFCLDPSTKYYVRAYVTNEYGTNYGEEITFTTREPVANYFKASTSGTNFNNIYMDDSTPGDFSSDQIEAYQLLGTALNKTNKNRELTKLQYYITPDSQGSPRYLCSLINYTSTDKAYLGTWKTKMDIDEKYTYVCSHFIVDTNVNTNSTSITNSAQTLGVWNDFLRSLNFISDHSFVLDWEDENTTTANDQTLRLIPILSPEKYKRMAINRYVFSRVYEDWW